MSDLFSIGGKANLISAYHVRVYGLTEAFRGMRNSWKSHANSTPQSDKELLMKLVKAGPEHRKALRMVSIYMDIKAPLYWWKQFDAYKVGIVENSESTMHTLMRDELSIDDFNYTDSRMKQNLLEMIRYFRIEQILYQQEKDEEQKAVIERRMIGMLPSCFLQKRTLCFNYETARNIYQQRKDHKLIEWHEFCQILECLPMSELITD